MELYNGKINLKNISHDMLIEDHQHMELHNLKLDTPIILIEKRGNVLDFIIYFKRPSSLCNIV